MKNYILLKTGWLPTFFKISLFVFSRRKKFIHFGNNLNVKISLNATNYRIFIFVWTISLRPIHTNNDIYYITVTIMITILVSTPTNNNIIFILNADFSYVQLHCNPRDFVLRSCYSCSLDFVILLNYINFNFIFIFIIIFLIFGVFAVAV